ncbi:type VI secretion protein [Bradyrhizobium quebecense]|uniref:Type VI secretion protein n=2 Tax=Bradyrhizobium quebecense TaxID=2748629 RepID=A0ACD3VK03_9BRAD|nr:type VI secretion protein [Bradyrhizobium quebecense]UGY06841.1 type VI secretion protein [Bradyrhizobium quebecense]
MDRAAGDRSPVSSAPGGRYRRPAWIRRRNDEFGSAGVWPRQADARCDRQRASAQSAHNQNHEMLGVRIARKGTCMKTLLFAAVAAGLLAQGAFAAEPACHKIDGTVSRLACYDAAFPPTVKKPPAIDSNAPRSEYKDPLIAEEARLAAKLKNICRGC